MMARCDKVPADVRAAAAEFLATLADKESTDPIPAITVPDAKKWRAMPDEELYRRADALRQTPEQLSRQKLWK